jgi:uncharacterized membrane protein
MEHIEKSIEVNVPVRTAYNQWTQFEEFPRFMEGVEAVEQVDDKRLRWKAKIAGKLVEWNAEITEQVPDRRIAWKSTSGRENSGVVWFDDLTGRTRVTLKMSYEPHGFAENAGDALGIVSRRVEGDLERFKEFIEKRGVETGGWRGKIHQGQVTDEPASRAASEERPGSERSEPREY